MDLETRLQRSIERLTARLRRGDFDVLKVARALREPDPQPLADPNTSAPVPIRVDLVSMDVEAGSDVQKDSVITR